MRKLVVLSFISLDGVMQAPGGPDEDRTGNFEYGGWTVNYFDDFARSIMGRQLGHPFDLLLGRKTYEIFASYWPNVGEEEPIAASLNNARKYVVSNTASNLSWKNSVLINGDVVEKIKKLKMEDGPELQVHGSGNMIQTLIKNELVDEYWLKIFPVTIGKGKRLFAEGTIPKSFKVIENKVSPKGVIIISYARGGELKTGTFTRDIPAKVEATEGKKGKR